MISKRSHREDEEMREKKRKAKRVIPGYGVSLGVTVTMLGLIVFIPLCSLVIFSAEMSFADFVETVTRPRVVSSYLVSFETSLVAAVIDAVMGMLIAWVLVRYEFPGKRLMNGVIELPFALPTAVAGISLTHLTTTNGWVGGLFDRLFGVKIAYTRVGITVALIFIGIPFVVRSVQPVLEKLDGQYEEAADILGASSRQTLLRVILPEVAPALAAGFAMSFARGLGEYGSVVFIAGNTPYETEIAPLIIMSQLQEFDYAGATSIALVMLFFAFLILLLNAVIQSRASRIVSGIS